MATSYPRNWKTAAGRVCRQAFSLSLRLQHSIVHQSHPRGCKHDKTLSVGTRETMSAAGRYAGSLRANQKGQNILGTAEKKDELYPRTSQFGTWNCGNRQQTPSNPGASRHKSYKETRVSMAISSIKYETEKQRNRRNSHAGRCQRVS